MTKIPHTKGATMKKAKKAGTVRAFVEVQA